MKQDQIKPGTSRGNTPDRERKTQPDAKDEKASVGGDYNSGVTSEDPEEKEQIEKQASLGKNQPKSHKENTEGEGDSH